MAFIDYGAIVKKDGIFINKNDDLFMKCSDTGYICKTAKSKYSDKPCIIDGNYFAYVGDEACLLVFYKSYWRMISHNKILIDGCGASSNSETFYPVKTGFPTITISHLDNNYYEDKDIYCLTTPWKEFVKENWYDYENDCACTGEEKLGDLYKGYSTYKWYLKQMKRIARLNKNHAWPKYHTNRYKAEWEWKNHQYEVIFGYGIDPSENIWKRIRVYNMDDEDGYSFTKIEKEIIDSWFGVK